MHKRRRLQGLAGLFVGQLLGRELAKLVIDQWQQTLAETPHGIQDYTFLDIGSGKGRVLMLASDAPFRHIVGVELSPALTAIACGSASGGATIANAQS